MRGPSLQKTALLSFALHLAAFLIIFLILRQSNHMLMPSPYTVSLVSPGDSRRVERYNRVDALPKPAVSAAAPDISRKSKEAVEKEKEIDEGLLAKRIEALRRKKTKMQAIKGKEDVISELAKHRKVVSLGAAKARHIGNPGKTAAGSTEKGFDYSSKIMDGIQPYWALPPGMEKKGLEAVVSIKILRDGRIVVQGIEKRSGNRIFDRSALQALADAYRLPPPPYEMEIGIRFHP